MDVVVDDEIFLAEKWWERLDGWEHVETIIRPVARDVIILYEEAGYTITRYKK